jgi:hypothetical protein
MQQQYQCPSCGALVAFGLRFCGNCGTELNRQRLRCFSHPDREAVNTCSKCGQPVCDACYYTMGTHPVCLNCVVKSTPPIQQSAMTEAEKVTKNCPTCGSSNALGQKFCGSCGADLRGSPQQIEKTNWLKRHLNWTLITTVVGTYLLSMVTSASEEITSPGRSLVGLLIQLVNPHISNYTLSWWYLPIWLALMLPVEGWVLRQKNRSLWHLLWGITPFGWIVILCLKNRSLPFSTNNHRGKKKAKTGLIRKAKTGTGIAMQIIGGILWFGCGLLMFIWTLYVLFSVFGVWTIFVGLILAPITYAASIFIIWFSEGVFPTILLIPYILSWAGMLMMGFGGTVTGED